MKILTLPLFLCAFLALSQAAAFPDNKDELVKEETDLKVLPEAEALNWTHAAGDELGTEENVLKDTEDEPETNPSDPEGDSHVENRAGFCRSGWTRYGARCFRYISASYTWAQAESYCVRSQGGNLPSVHSAAEYSWLQRYVHSKTRGYPPIWLGGSDSKKDRLWFWSDSSRFRYSNWCSGTPRTSTRVNCIIMNASNRRCWFDYPCGNRYSFVCIRKAR